MVTILAWVLPEAEPETEAHTLVDLGLGPKQQECEVGSGLGSGKASPRLQDRLPTAHCTP